MNTKLAHLIALALVLFQFSALAVADTEPAAPAKTVYAKPETLTFEISNLKDEEIVRVALTFQPNIKAIKPFLVDVALGERHDNSLMAFFEVKPETILADPKVAPAMLIKVKPKSLQTGTYKLRIDLLPAIAPPTATPPAKGTKAPASKAATTAAGAKAQSITVEIKIPAAKLHEIQKLVIHQVRYCLVCDDPPLLALSEISGKGVRLTDVTISQTYPTAGENRASSETVKFESLAGIAPNTTEKSKITLSGNFPLGTSSGAVLVSAPQLTEPEWITFEVKSRLARWIIVLVMILGLILGFVVRVWSKHRVELREARLKGLDAVAALREELKRPDAIFRELVQPPLTTLESVVENGSIETVNKAIGGANTKLTAALSDLNDRRTLAKNQLEALMRLVKRASALPPEIAAAIKIDAAVLEAGRVALEHDDVAKAQQTLAPLTENLSTKLADATSAWRADVKSLLEQLTGSLIFLPEKIASGIEGEIPTFNTTKLDSLVFATNDPSLEDITTFVRSVTDAAGEAKALILRTGNQLANSVNTLKTGYDSLLAPPEPELVKQLFEGMADWLKKFPGWVEHPKDAASELSQTLAQLKTLWREAFMAQIKGIDEALESYHESLKEDHYFTAAFDVITYLREHPPKADDIALGDAESGAVASTNLTAFSQAAVSFFNLFGKSPEADVTLVTNVQPSALPPNLEALRARTWQELATTKALRFAVASLLILAIGYALFVDQFVGTFNELLAIFVWAFGTNIGVDTVTDSMKKVEFK